MIYIGIDPGVSGGIAFVGDRFNPIRDAVKMPATERDVFDVLIERSKWSIDQLGNCNVRAVLERVSASPQMGVVSAFTFGRGVGVLRMALVAAEIPFDEVTPQTWQRAMGCLTKGDKNITKRRAQQLFPSLTITHAIADALLIAEFCRRVHQGAPNGQRPPVRMRPRK